MALLGAGGAAAAKTVGEKMKKSTGPTRYVPM